jgi:SAM-dependent methyltransferase
MANDRFYEVADAKRRRSAPAALRNREPIADVLADWLPASGLVLEVASGTGEHSVHFAGRFPDLDWQPSDTHAQALASIRAWRKQSELANLRDPIELDASAPDWPMDRADAVLNINMVHITPWSAAIGLLTGAQRLLAPGAPLILYGPWFSDRIETAPSNLAFDSDLKARDPEWGLRRVEDFAAEAQSRGFEFVAQRPMPANNLMLLFRKGTVSTRP